MRLYTGNGRAANELRGFSFLSVSGWRLFIQNAHAGCFEGQFAFRLFDGLDFRF